MSLVRSGWTRVRRLEDRGFADGGEGYVPTSFLKTLWGGTTRQGLGDSVDRGYPLTERRQKCGPWCFKTMKYSDCWIKSPRISASLEIRFMWFALRSFVSIARPMVFCIHVFVRTKFGSSSVVESVMAGFINQSSVVPYEWFHILRRSDSLEGDDFHLFKLTFWNSHKHLACTSSYRSLEGYTGAPNPICDYMYPPL